MNNMTSLGTQVRGLTSWINFRLPPPEHVARTSPVPDFQTSVTRIDSVLKGLTKGLVLKQLVFSLTGNDLPRCGSFDGLSQMQRLTRLQMAIDAMRRCSLLANDFKTDIDKLAAGRAEQVFHLVWRLVCHDVEFLFERVEFLRQNVVDLTEDDVINQFCCVAFTWCPRPIPPAAPAVAPSIKLNKHQSGSKKKSKAQEQAPDQPARKSQMYVPFPNDHLMTSFVARGDGVKTGCNTDVHVTETDENSSQSTAAMSRKAQERIADMISGQLKTTSEGRTTLKQDVPGNSRKSLEWLCNIRVLCSLVNSFVPGLLPTEVFLDDRWAIDLVLRTAETAFRMPPTTMSAEDLLRADTTAVCSYFCALLMSAYRFRQCAVVAHHAKMLFRKRRYLTLIGDTADSYNLILVDSRLSRLSTVFNVDFCVDWDHDIHATVRRQVRQQIRDRMTDAFDLFCIPRDSVTRDDLVTSFKVDLSLTQSDVGFCRLESCQKIRDGRKLVVRDVKSGQYMWRHQPTIRRLLGLAVNEDDEIAPSELPTHLRVYAELISKNVRLKTGQEFLYQIFPHQSESTSTCNNDWRSELVRRVIRERDADAVDRLTRLFDADEKLINARATSAHRGDAPLHAACRIGRTDIVEMLLERGSDVNLTNKAGQTALDCACLTGHYEVARLLVEWGCDDQIATLEKCCNGSNFTELQDELSQCIRDSQIRDNLLEVSRRLADIIAQVVDNSDVDAFKQFVDDHVTGNRPLVSSRSRCIDGSTILHAAVYFGRPDLAARLLASSPEIDVAMTDYRGATALHRARGHDTVRLLLVERADPGARDMHGNTPLHVQCYGETSRPSDLDAIRALINDGRAQLDAVNSKGLTGLHCAAMQGRVDVIEILVAGDAGREGKLASHLASNESKLPSPVYMSLVNDHFNCAAWLQTECPMAACSLRSTESDRLLRRLITGKMEASNEAEVARFLIENGGARVVDDDGGCNLLHMAAERGSGAGPLIEVLVDNGADVNAVESGQTPLHVVCSHGVDAAGAVTLVRLGADWTLRRPTGERPFDLVDDLDTWIESGVFDDEPGVVDEMKRSKLRQVRHLVRTITRKVRVNDNSAELNIENILIQRLCDIEQYNNTFSPRWTRPYRRK